VSSASVDRSTVDIDRGEMSFQLFKMPDDIDGIIDGLPSNSDKLDRLGDVLGEGAFPIYLKQFITRTSTSLERDVEIHPSINIAGYSDDDPGLDKKLIQRRRGFIGKSQRGKNPSAVHHLYIIQNADNDARLFYKFNGSVQFIKNLK
jgi:hypothetical protein